jgi:3-hydroxybutyryl-CoA dehydratase
MNSASSDSVNDFGLEDLSVGQKEEISVMVSEDAVDRFAELSGDVSPIHVDAGYAAGRGFKGRVAHGMLAGAFISRLIGTRLPGRRGLLQSIDLEFRRPIIPPQTLVFTAAVKSISASTGQVTIEVTGTDLQDQLVCRAKVRSIVK